MDLCACLPLSMRSVLAILLLVGVALAGQTCTTVTDFSFGKLIKESSPIHITTWRAHFESGVLHFQGTTSFEVRPGACLRSIEVAPTKEGAAMPTVTAKTYHKRYNVETMDKAVLISDAQGKIDLGEDRCDVISVSITAEQETALKSVVYCSAQGETKKRSIDTRDVEEEAVATEGDKPVIPVPYCTGSLGGEDGHSYCLGVFSYINGNNYTVALDSNHTFFVPSAHAFSMAPTNYYAGEQEASVGVIWRCDKHIDSQIMFSIITPMTNTSIQHEERHDAALIRNFRRRCSVELLSEFAESDLSSLLDAGL